MCLDSMFGAPTGDEKSAQGMESTISRDLMANYQQQYAQQQDVLKQLTAQTSRIQSGNTGPGFGGAENAALISGIVNAGGAAARNAIQATQDRGAGQTFNGQSNTSGLARASAIRQQVAGQISSAVGANTANQLTAENAANYATGRQTALQSADLLSKQVSLYSPESYATGASSANQASFKMADTIRKEQEEATQGKINFGVKLAGMAAGGIFGGIGGMGGGALGIAKGAVGGALGDPNMFNQQQDPNNS